MGLIENSLMLGKMEEKTITSSKVDGVSSIIGNGCIFGRYEGPDYRQIVVEKIHLKDYRVNTNFIAHFTSICLGLDLGLDLPFYIFSV